MQGLTFFRVHEEQQSRSSPHSTSIRLSPKEPTASKLFYDFVPHSTISLLRNCYDWRFISRLWSSIEATDHFVTMIHLPRHPSRTRGYILVVEGNISAGKTTLCGELVNLLADCKVYLEPTSQIRIWSSSIKVTTPLIFGTLIDINIDNRSEKICTPNASMASSTEIWGTFRWSSLYQHPFDSFVLDIC